MNKSETIQLSTIDDYCNINKIERIHFLKLDIDAFVNLLNIFVMKNVQKKNICKN